MLVLAQREKSAGVGCIGCARPMGCVSGCRGNVVRSIGQTDLMTGAAGTTMTDIIDASFGGHTTAAGLEDTTVVYGPGDAPANGDADVTVEDDGKGGEVVVFTPTDEKAPPVEAPAKATWTPMVLGGIAVVLLILWTAFRAKRRRR